MVIVKGLLMVDARRKAVMVALVAIIVVLSIVFSADVYYYLKYAKLADRDAHLEWDVEVDGGRMEFEIGVINDARVSQTLSVYCHAFNSTDEVRRCRELILTPGAKEDLQISLAIPGGDPFGWTSRCWIIEGPPAKGWETYRAGGIKVVAIGDSLTKGSPYHEQDPNLIQTRYSLDAAGYPYFLGNLLGTSIPNRGVAGDTAGGISSRLGPEALRGSPDVVIIMAGTNDIESRSSDHIITLLWGMYTRALDAGAEVVALTLPPFGIGDADSYRILSEVNDWIRSLNMEGITVVDAHALLADPVDDMRLIDEYDCGDGVHLSQSGYAILAKHIFETVFV